MINKHTCLDGEDRLGEEFDCPKCRALLLNSFSEPVQVPDICCSPALPCEKHWTGPVPPVGPDEVIQEQGSTSPFGHVPQSPGSLCNCSSCNPDICAYCGHEKGKPGCTFCATVIKKHVDPDRGSWHVWCSCGWEEKGWYAPDSEGFNHIQLMIDELGKSHHDETHKPKSES